MVGVEGDAGGTGAFGCGGGSGGDVSMDGRRVSSVAVCAGIEDCDTSLGEEVARAARDGDAGALNEVGLFGVAAREMYVLKG